VRVRLRRALAHATGVIGAPVQTAAVFTTYDPRRVAGALSAGLGVGSLGGGTSATTVALGRLANWGEREARQFEILPRRVLVATTADAVHVFEWPVSAHARQIACWERESFQARTIHHRLEGQVDVFIALPTHKNAVLTAKAGPFRRPPLSCAQAITQLSEVP
jgi:hypothetical protein